MIGRAWASVPLGDLFEISAGKTMSPSARSGANQIPFLRTKNVLWDEIDLSELDYMHYDESDLRTKTLRPGDLLVCEGGEVGRAAIWDGEIDPIGFQNHLHRLRPRTGGVFTSFYVYYLQSAFTQLGIFEGASNKTTIPNLSRNRLALLLVPFPSEDEQREIANVLSATREAMRIGEKRADLLKELFASVLFRSMVESDIAVADELLGALS